MCTLLFNYVNAYMLVYRVHLCILNRFAELESGFIELNIPLIMHL